MSAPAPLAETVKMYGSREDAAKAACTWVEQGKTKVDRSKLRVYISTVGPFKGSAVGEYILRTAFVICVGLLRNSGIVEDIVRLDNDDTGKGIHYNAKNLSDTSQKLAACIQPTISMAAGTRMNLYRDYLKAIENLSADTIWDWWRTGTKPMTIEAEAEGDSVSAAVETGAD
ncbi:hypothetical protein EWM64_g386 [Hericium alpestre]|uniref:Uncharacterized protein n=1 Tax=Hericium alpestre TaxID=135208 RepID=A0A4Z0AC47_9AGAM|nr:hypothetical protein EWM64_g386 [Hericium alpestre]